MTGLDNPTVGFPLDGSMLGVIPRAWSLSSPRQPKCVKNIPLISTDKDKHKHTNSMLESLRASKYSLHKKVTRHLRSRKYLIFSLVTQ